MTECIYKLPDGNCAIHSDAPSYLEPCVEGPCGEMVTAPDQTIKADAGKAQLSLVPPQIMHDIAIIREYGNRKYSDPDSWRRVDPQRYIDALLRHALTLGANPLGKDEESGLPHLWHLECNAAFLSEMYRDEFRRLLDSEWRKEN